MKYATTPGQIPYRKDIFREDMEYMSLTILDLSEKDRAFVIKTIEKKKLVSGKWADLFVKSEAAKEPFGPWTYEKIDLHGRTSILKYKGVEVALFHHRQLTKKRIEPDSPYSERKLKDPDDAWMRLDLTGLSARQIRKSTVELVRKLEKENENLKHKVNLQSAIIDQLEADKSGKEKRKRKAKTGERHGKATRRKERRATKAKQRSRKSRR